MAKYSGLPYFKVLLLGSLLIGGTAAADEMNAGPAAQAMPASEPLPADSTASMSREEVPLHYVVKKGDTLWSISRHFLLDPWQWPEIWYVNGQLSNPHKIYPGDVLSLMVVNGHPQMTRDAAPQNPYERLSPQVRASTLDDAIPAIPIDAIRDFLHSPRVVLPEDLKKAPYILEFVDDHLVAGAASKVYVRKLPPGDQFIYSVVRLGAPYKDPETHELLGYEALPIGTSETQQPGDPGIALLTTTTREALVGDYFIPVEQETFDANFYPHAPKTDINGRILSVYDGVSQIGQYQVIALNRGGRDGLERGHVLTVMQSGRTAKDPHGAGSSMLKLPDQPAGVAMVFKVTPRVSYALVMEATRPIHVLDRVVKPPRNSSH